MDADDDAIDDDDARVADADASTGAFGRGDDADAGDDDGGDRDDADAAGDDAAAADVRFRCPGCDEDVDVSAAAVGRLVRCPYCSTAFFPAPDGTATADVVDDTDPPPADDAPRPGELDAVRIRQLTTLRRATIRARSWWLGAALLAAAVAADLLIRAGRYVNHYHAWGRRATVFAAVASVFVLTVIACLRHAARLAAEAAATSLPPPATEPDFSTLDDGTAFRDHLNHVR